MIPVNMSFQAVKNAWFKRVDSQILQAVENFQGIISNLQVIYFYILMLNFEID
jgi:hypothetical protein